jgi:hypothetical protein
MWCDVVKSQSFRLFLTSVMGKLQNHCRVLVPAEKQHAVVEYYTEVCVIVSFSASFFPL